MADASAILLLMVPARVCVDGDVWLPSMRTIPVRLDGRRLLVLSTLLRDIGGRTLAMPLRADRDRASDDLSLCRAGRSFYAL